MFTRIETGLTHLLLSWKTSLRMLFCNYDHLWMMAFCRPGRSWNMYESIQLEIIQNNDTIIHAPTDSVKRKLYVPTLLQAKRYIYCVLEQSTWFVMWILDTYSRTVVTTPSKTQAGARGTSLNTDFHTHTHTHKAFFSKNECIFMTVYEHYTFNLETCWLFVKSPVVSQT